MATVYGRIWDCHFTLAMHYNGIWEVQFLRWHFMIMGFGIAALPWQLVKMNSGVAVFLLRQFFIMKLGIAVLPW